MPPPANDSAPDTDTVPRLLAPWFIAPFVIALWISSFYCISIFVASLDDDSRTILTDAGTFGDLFGAINALFSGLAFAGIIYTIILQRKELTLQRHELQETRKEFTQQNETLSMQRFENTFFHLLSLHNDIVEKLSFAFKYTAQGRASFSRWRQKIDNDVRQLLDTSAHHELSEAYRSMSSRNTFDSYFRNLYHLYRFVHATTLPRDQKQFYADIVTAQLSTDELYCLAYNALLHPKSKFLLDTYHVLSKLDTTGTYPSLITFINSQAPNPFKSEACQ